MVWIDTSLRRILCSEEVKRAWGLLQESGKVLAAQHWLYHLDLCPATNLSHDLHRLFCHLFIVDCDWVRVLFELDDRFGTERLADAFDDFFHFRLRSLPSNLVERPYRALQHGFVRYDVLLGP